MILLDTNVVSEAQHQQGDPRVRSRVAERHGEIHLSTIVLGEILYGVHLLPPGARRTRLEGYYRELSAAFGERVLPVIVQIAEEWGRLRATARRSGRTLAAADGLIAATAIVHDLTLWTRNVGDFDGTGVRLFNPWEG